MGLHEQDTLFSTHSHASFPLCDTVNKENGDLTLFVHPSNEWIADFIAYYIIQTH
jgi:hypothetical protein